MPDAGARMFRPVFKLNFPGIVDLALPGSTRDSLFTKGPSDALDHATSEIASGRKLGLDATMKLPGEGFKRPWPRSSRWMRQ